MENLPTTSLIISYSFIAVSNYLCKVNNSLIMTTSGLPGEFRFEYVQWIISESDILSSVRAEGGVRKVGVEP